PPSETCNKTMTVQRFDSQIRLQCRIVWSRAASLHLATVAVMVALATEYVIEVHHWNDSLFSFRTTRDPGFRFDSGHFVMLGLEVEGKPLLRAYSIASANYEEHLEFVSIIVQDGPLTSRLQHLKPGDPIMVSRKPTGTLVL